MAYGTLKCDNITFTNGGIDQTVTVSGIVQSISGNITATGTIQGATIIGTSTVSGATVTGTVGNFGSGSAAAPSVSVGTTDKGIYSPGADQVAISTNGTGQLFVDASGNVGVGTGSPAEKLHVNGTVKAITYTSLGTFNDLTPLQFDRGTVGAGMQIQLESGGYRLVATDKPLIFNSDYSTGVIAFRVNNDEKLRILSSGNVGIGTTSPDTKLNIVQSSTGRAWSPTAGQGDLIVERNGNAGLAIVASNASASSINFGDTDDENAGFITYYHNDDALAFRTGGTGEDVRIDISGRLLVGTSSDSGGALLQVNGDRVRIATAKTPASASATGTAGEVCWDTNYIYVCTATNTWKRAALSTW